MKKKNSNGMIMWFIFLTIIVIVIAVAVYFGINEAYLKNDGYATVWTADVALMYFGTVLGAMVTVIALSVTIYFTNKSNAEDREYQTRKSVCELKKERLIQEHEDYLKIVQSVKIVILLEEYDDFSCWKMLIGEEINSLVQKIMGAAEKCNYQIKKEDITQEFKNFWAYNLSIIKLYLDAIYNYAKKEEETAIKRETLKEIEKKISPILSIIEKHKLLEKKKKLAEQNKSSQIILHKIEFDIEMSNEKINDVDIKKYYNYESPYIESKNELYTELKKSLNMIISEKKEGYLDICEKYVEYEKDLLSENIKKLYEIQ